METLFKKISEEENGDYHVIYEKSYQPYLLLPLQMKENGLQIKSLQLKIPYDNQIIEIEYSFSKTHVGVLFSQLKDGFSIPQFQISNRSHYKRLFNKKLNILKINCEDPKFRKYLTSKLDELQIEHIAREVKFESQITGRINNDQYEIKTSFHLAFSEKKTVLRPMINLYKCLIDYKAS